MACGHPCAWLISIHAPREGCDFGVHVEAEPVVQISIHAPREGCDGSSSTTGNGLAFQSTHPVRGATTIGRYVRQVIDISIHAPREGCDVIIYK